MLLNSATSTVRARRCRGCNAAIARRADARPSPTVHRPSRRIGDRAGVENRKSASSMTLHLVSRALGAAARSASASRSCPPHPGPTGVDSRLEPCRSRPTASSSTRPTSCVSAMAHSVAFDVDGCHGDITTHDGCSAAPPVECRSIPAHRAVGDETSIRRARRSTGAGGMQSRAAARDARAVVRRQQRGERRDRPLEVGVEADSPSRSAAAHAGRGARAPVRRTGNRSGRAGAFSTTELRPHRVRPRRDGCADARHPRCADRSAR